MRLFGINIRRELQRGFVRAQDQESDYDRGWHIGFEAGIDMGRDMGPVQEEPEARDEKVLDREDVIVRNFTYHPPKGDQIERYHRVRDNAMDLALLINDITPVSREQSLALTNLEQFVFWSNAAIARNE